MLAMGLLKLVVNLFFISISISLGKEIDPGLRFTGQISAVLNGRETLQFVKESTQEHTCEPNIILLDLNMPVKNGRQFLHAFNRLRKDLTSLF